MQFTIFCLQLIVFSENIIKPLGYFVKELCFYICFNNKIFIKVKKKSSDISQVYLHAKFNKGWSICLVFSNVHNDTYKGVE